MRALTLQLSIGDIEAVCGEGKDKNGDGGPQVVWIRLGNISNIALWQAIEPLLDEIIRALNAGEELIEVL